MRNAVSCLKWIWWASTWRRRSSLNLWRRQALALVIRSQSAQLTARMVSLWQDQEQRAGALREANDKLRTEVAKVADVGLTLTVGGRPQEIRGEPDPPRLARPGVPLGGRTRAIAG